MKGDDAAKFCERRLKNCEMVEGFESGQGELRYRVKDGEREGICWSVRD